MSEEIPTIGRVVRYVSKNGDGIISPAIILRTRAATDPEVAASWEKGGREGRPHKPLGSPPEGFQIELGSDTHVDLLVHGLSANNNQVYNSMSQANMSAMQQLAGTVTGYTFGLPTQPITIR